MTESKFKKDIQIHTFPDEDASHKHTPSLKCKCKPKVIKCNSGIIYVDHLMVGEGPDKWTVAVVTETS